MPVSLNPVGSSLDISIVDDNFETLQDLFRSGLLSADFAAQFNRFNVYRYTSGRMVSARTFDNPSVQRGSRDEQAVVLEKYDLTFRRGSRNSSDVRDVYADLVNEQRENYAMELLGLPGPSMYYTFQEMGFPDPSTFPSVSWPPSQWPPQHYPDHLCFSRWLTIPGASIKLYVPEGAVARVSGTAIGTLTLWAAISALDSTSNLTTPWSEFLQHKRENNAFRFGLIVDTNPNITDEWVNTNPYILDPTTGAQAAYKSWKIIEDKTLYATHRETFHIKEEIFLQGGKHYNFRFAFRDAAHHGTVLWDGVNYTWYSLNWDGLSGGGFNIPENSTWTGPVPHPFQAPLFNLWESTRLDVELFYGRSGDHAASQSDTSLNK